jgi:hypothetical protein
MYTMYNISAKFTSGGLNEKHVMATILAGNGYMWKEEYGNGILLLR